MDRDPTIEQLTAALAALRATGSPVAGQTDAEHRHIAEIALRRWTNFHRWSKGRPSTHEQRIEDLAKGLRDALERYPRLTGPLMRDYRHVARDLAEILRNRG